MQNEPVPPLSESVPRHLSIAPVVVWRDVAEDLVLFDESTGAYHSLNRVGSFVWRRLGEGKPLPQIIDEAVQHFDADAAVIARGVTDFVAVMLDLKLLIAPDAITGK